MTEAEKIAAELTEAAMQLDPIIDLEARFGPILKAAFPNEHSVTRLHVAHALAEAALSRPEAGGKEAAGEGEGK